MSANNTAIGSALIIPNGLLYELDKVDEKIKKIQDTSRATANVFNNSFALMSGNLKTGILTHLQQVIDQINNVGIAAKTASSATQNMGSGFGSATQGANNLSNSIVVIVENINRMIAHLQQTGQVGSSSLMAAKLAADKLMEAMKYDKAGGDIANLKSRIESITSALNDTEHKMSKARQDALVEQKRRLQDELKEAERTQNERAVNLQRVLDRMMRAEQSYQRQVEQARKKTAQDYQRQNYASNTTYSGSLSFADNANTINRRTQAIKYLTEARNALSKTDADYANKLATLNAKIKELNAENRQAIASSQELNNKHRNLMDTAGQLQRAFALLFSVSQIRGYISQIAKVRGEFELQQRSLEAILQNKTKADEIFNKTVALAVQSPYQIKDLVSYTKQLAAYRIESDKLYDTTKRLADVSAGLGVDMQRIILAYGQVKAAAYLRGCLGYNTPIRMFDGSIKMVQDVEVGDVLVNEKGEKVNVKELIRGREQMYIVHQKGGVAYRVNENHILTLYKNGDLHDIYVNDYDKSFLGAKCEKGNLICYEISIEKDVVDDYYGFVLDGNRRFLLGDGTVTHNTEVRQFTEAGINLYGELQSYFKEVKGEAYTTAQIVDMISKRMVTFEDVEAIFKRITDQGGIFYNMQAIQAETLQGKIANLKDSIDVMLNDIGKANEDAFKGTINATNYVIRNWEAIADTGKALVAVLLLLKIHSLRTGAAMSSVFTTSMMANAANTLKSTELLKSGFLSLSKSVKVFGANLKAAFMTNLPLIGITAALTAVISLIDWLNETQKATLKVAKEIGKLKKQLSDISTEFNAASKLDGGFDIEEKKKALERLKKMVADANLKVELTVEESKDVDKIFAKFKSKANEYIKLKSAIENAVVENNQRWEWGGTLGENIDKDAEDYVEAYNKVIAKTSELDAAIALLYDDYDKLSDEQKKLLDEGTKRQGGQSEIEYLRQQSDAVRKVTDLFGVTLDRNVVKAREYNRNIRYFLFNWGADNSYDNAKAELISEIDDLITRAKKRYTQADWNKVGEDVIRSVIDGMSSDKGWSDEIKEQFYQAFNIPINIDKDSLNSSLNEADAAIRDFFARKKYTIKINTKEESAPNLQDLNKTTDDYIKRYRELRKEIKQLSDPKADPDLLLSRFTKYGKIAAPKEDYKRLIQQAIDERKKELEAIKAEVIGMGRGEELITKDDKIAAKQQRDILSEQVALLKEMQKRYEDLRSVMGEQDAKTNVLTYYSDSLKNVKMPESIINSFVPTREGVIAALDKLLPTISDFKKKMDVRNTIAELKLQIDKDGLEKELDKAKKEVEKAFNGFALNTKLTDLGLHSYDINKLFPGLTKSLDDVRNTIYREFSMTPEMLQMNDAQLKLKMGEKKYQEYTSAIKKLNDQEVDDQRRNVEQLVKDYKNHIDSKLQIDLWYANERDKINKNISEPTLRDEMQSNLDKQYKEKVDDNKWKSFQESDAYIKIFNNLENASKQTLDYLYSRLETLKSSLNNLSPENLKQVVEAMNKIDSERTDRNPFKGLTKNIKEYIKYLKERKKLEQERNTSLSKEEELSAQAEKQNSTVQFYEKQYDLAQKLYAEKAKSSPLAKKEITDAEELLTKARAELKAIKEKLRLQKQVTTEKNDEIDKGEQSANKTNKAIQDMGNYAQQTATAIRGIGDAFGGLSSEAEVAVDVIDNIGQAIGNYYSGNYGAMVANAAGALSGIFQLFSGDISRRERIKELSAEISKLQNAFERLQGAMDDAWSISSLEKYKNESIRDLQLINRKLQQMIELEKDCKNPDEEKIVEWENQIQDNIDTIIELGENFYESLGGLGSDANIKSAAQEFADAWYEAFNEGSDTMDALEDKFNDLIDNMIKKQLMMRVTEKYLKPVFDLIDQAVSSDGETANGMVRLREGLEKINAQSPDWLKQANEAYKEIVNFLGLTPNADSALSGLQQGIQGITENTASALESLLNSMRFFLATQQSDVAAIKNHLLSKGEIVSDSSTTSPMLTELKNQTNVLKNIQSMWERVIKPMSGGYGLRVIGIS